MDQPAEILESEEHQSADASVLTARITTNQPDHVVVHEAVVYESTGQHSSSAETSQHTYAVDGITTGFFDISSKITAFTATQPCLPKSLEMAQKVSSSRPFAASEKLVRKGRNAMDVETPLRIKEHVILLLFAANYKKQPRGIIYNEHDGTVSFPELALSTLVNGMAGNASFSPEELDVMDVACAAFLQELILAPTEHTKEGTMSRCFTHSLLLMLNMHIFNCRTQRATG